MRNLTSAQIARRSALLERLRVQGCQTADMLRSYLVHRKRIIVTVDTVQRDLRAMEAVGTLRRRGLSSAGRAWGNGRSIIWSMAE
jgi:DeoR/GlpR family transcriptional regulator of sugar metabolism